MNKGRQYEIIKVYCMLIEDGLNDDGCLVTSVKTWEEVNEAVKTQKFGEIITIKRGYIIVDEKGNPAPIKTDVYWKAELDKAYKELEILNKLEEHEIKAKHQNKVKVKEIMFHDSKNQGDIDDNKPFMDFLEYLKDKSSVINISERYNDTVTIYISGNDLLNDVYMYYTEEKGDINIVDGHILEIKGNKQRKLSKLKELLLKNPSCFLEKKEVVRKVEALKALY